MTSAPESLPWNETPEAFLPRRIPQLQPDRSVFEVHGFG